MRIKGVYETHLPVQDMDRSIAFYRDVLQLPLAHVSAQRTMAFFWAPTAEVGMLGLWAAGPSPISIRSHFAFTVDTTEIAHCVPWLRERGLTPTDSTAPIDEPMVHTWMPAASVYFLDPDGHSLEFIAKLPGPPQPDLARMPLSQWRAML